MYCTDLSYMYRAFLRNLNFVNDSKVKLQDIKFTDSKVRVTGQWVQVLLYLQHNMQYLLFQCLI